MSNALEALESRLLLSGDPVIVGTTSTETDSETLGTLALTAAGPGTWGPVLDWGLQAKHMVALPTGDVLVWSTGQNASVWDAETNTLTPVPFFFGDLHCAAQVTLADGRVAVFGGQDGEPHVGIEVTALFDPFTNTWTNNTVMNFERWYATATTLGDGRVLVTSGDDHGEARVTIPEIYDPVTDSWTLLTGADRSQGLYPEMFVLPNGKIYEAGSKTDTWYLDINGVGSWTQGPTNSFGSSGYAESAVMYAPGKILRAGGGDPAFASAAIIDTNVANPQWQTVESMEFARRRMNLTILADGSVMAIGGTGQADNVNQAVLAAEIWDPDTQQWTTVASMSEARMYHSSAVLLPDGRVLTGGGEASGRLHAQIYTPAYVSQPRPTITSAPNTAAFGSTFTLQTPEAADITSVSLIRPGAPTHAFDHNQRYVPLSFQRVGDHLQVTAPPDGNTAPPGYYMLIVENGAGVPSVATWIQINSNDNLAPGKITGRITNSVSGLGIADATVSTTFGSVTTDSNGFYTLIDIPAGEHLVTVSAAGFATFSQSQQVLPNQTATLNINLVAPGEVTGLVTSVDTGIPLAGVKISYSGGSVLTGADGTFSAPNVPSGLQTIIASKLGFQNVQHDADVQANGSISLNFSLPTALTAIEGEVRDIHTGDPIEGATVMYNDEMMTTNASGFYIFRDVAPGEYHVMVTAPHYQGMTQHVLVASGFASTADFNLLPEVPSTITLNPTDDALVKTSNPTKNYGQQDALRIRTGTTDSYRSFLKFNVSDLDGAPQKATLRLWSTDASSSTGRVYLVSNNLNGSANAWTENNITWNNAPAIAGTPLASMTGTPNGAFVDFDVTSAITGNGIFSFGMLNTTTTSMYFSSSEGSNSPQLILESFAHHDEPMIMHFTPESGNAGTVVAIHGMNFSGVTSVLFNGIASTQVGFVSETEVRALVPVGVTTGPITVTTVNGTATSSENFTVTSTPPTITTTLPALNYNENDPATAIDPDLATSDTDNTNFFGATVAITSGFASGQDLLDFTNQNGISGSYNAATGILTLTGTSSVSNYQSALRSVTYANSSENPSNANRTVTFSVSDGVQSVSATKIVTVTRSNDPPVAGNNSYSVTQGQTLTANDTTGATGTTGDDSVLRNDTDLENDPLFAFLITEPANAAAFTLNHDGTFSYTHNGSVGTSDSFTYQATDENGISNTATVTITIIPTAPEVTVLGNSVSIADNDTTPSAADFTSFGSATQGGATISRTFTVRNDGTATLNLNALTVPTGFTVTEVLSDSLAPGAFDTFTVRLDTTTSGTKSGQISFTTNDSDESTFNFSISGTVNPAGGTTTAAFQDGVSGYAGTTDTSIRGDQLTKNYGTLTGLQMHGSPDKAALIRWNVSSIPAGSVVQSASITVNVTNLSNQSFEIYGLLRSWVENQASWSAAATGNNWQTAGAQGANDRNPAILGSITAPSNGLITINLNAAGIAQVQSWINTPSTNNGVLIQDYATTDGLDFDSSEATTVANRPKLTIVYTPGVALLAAAPLTSFAARVDSSAGSIATSESARIVSSTKETTDSSLSDKSVSNSFGRLLSSKRVHRSSGSLARDNRDESHDTSSKWSRVRSHKVDAADIDDYFSKLAGAIGSSLSPFE